MSNIVDSITKEIFEAHVPAAKMPERNSSVFLRLHEMFEESYEQLIRNIIGESFEAETGSNEKLRGYCVREICLDAFVRTCRSLDLVLTSTGFGVVQTESTAPASKARVDALVEECSVNKLIVVDSIIQTMTSMKGWGESEQAQLCIPTLFYRPLYFRKYTVLPFTVQSWQSAQGNAVTAESYLRLEISDEYMDDLLHCVRSNNVGPADSVIIDKCLRFMGDYISRPNVFNASQVTKSERAVGAIVATPSCDTLNLSLLRNIVDTMECDIQNYKVYRNSQLYAKRHAERYQNKKDDTTFFFM